MEGEKKSEGRRYNFINTFDVWGNAKDGWVINNQCVEFEDVFIAYDSSDKEILSYLKELGFLATDDMRRVCIDHCNPTDTIEICARKGMMPLGYFSPIA